MIKYPRRDFGFVGMLAFADRSVFSILLVACSQEEWLKKIASPDEPAVAQKFIQQLRNQDFGDLEKAIDPSIADQLQGGVLDKMAVPIVVIHTWPPRGDSERMEFFGFRNHR